MIVHCGDHFDCWYTKKMILGIDEVGRGPWAGPLVVGAVVLGSVPIEGLADSKKLTKKKREELNDVILREAAGHGLGWVSAKEIDSIGLSAALRLATVRAVEQVKTPYQEIIIDGTINFLADTTKGRYVSTLAKADHLIPSVSAASIIAKVARDNYMAKQDAVFPGYEFSRHVGYGTAIHRAAIAAHGITPLHRLSFAPLKHYQPRSEAIVTTTQVGNTAEQLVAEHFVSKGHVILERNWKIRWCEIDIISKKNETVYFTEVKYRKTAHRGDGFASITVKKQQQMRFAAELYMNGRDISCRLLAASVSAVPPVIDQILEVE